MPRHMWRTSVCEGCNELIQDRYMLRVQDGLWHERCLHCASCSEPLKNTCFLRNKTLYCKQDYQKLFLVRCKGCAEVISPADLVMRLGTAVFHLRCFCCCVCSCRLQKGDRCVLMGDRLLCARDFHNTLASPINSDSGKSEDEEEEDDEGNINTGPNNTPADVEHKRPKRPRTILTTQQRRAFKASFEVSSKPCRKVRETLAAETGLSVRVVQVWFQNQRAKMKKLARRQQQQKQSVSSQEKRDSQAQHTAPSCGALPTELECTGSYVSLSQQNINLESYSFKLDPFRQGLTPPQMPGDHMHPYGCDTFYDNADSDPLCHFEDCRSGSNPCLLTPIDRLYSMQDSYFTS
ncbi:LIM homeobox transcription factor 1-alpha LIM/homeobox protein 1.1 [Triplophysa tibetana]|uniref:LIM homeobox transcription factor 1-alpha LIM/homeobox protein 1.1 n=1 Tax=Triplophysa tibetana TaxID=1572043 RepID=A0A5A9NH08_9TELE|nr:LIM homeobox transcription factor 1-alpha LIM/homeobox protein 1.1 [Triplophysa tibetana]